MDKDMTLAKLVSITDAAQKTRIALVNGDMKAAREAAAEIEAAFAFVVEFFDSADA